MQETLCNIASVSLLNKNVYRVVLSWTQENLVRSQDPFFLAGQYLMLALPSLSSEEETQWVPYSIASPPYQKQQIELHILRSEQQSISCQVMDYLQSHEQVRVQLPFGQCYVDQLPQTPMLFLAASTGFAQCKSMIEHLIRQGCEQKIYVYWGVRQVDDLYLNHLPSQWVRQCGVEFTPVVQNPDEGWKGATGLIHEAVFKDFPEFNNQIHVIASGSPRMVYAVYDDMIARGLPQDNMSSDVFEYAPRESRSS